MKNNINLLFILISLSFSEEYHDVIYLKDGTIIKGTIIETKPNEYIKRQINDS